MDIVQQDPWQNLVEQAISNLENVQSRVLPSEHLLFSKSEGFRYGPKKAAIQFLSIFPWFLDSNGRYRESLNPNTSGKTIGDVMEALQYMWQFPYCSAELEFLRQLYSEMGRNSIKCLSSIVEVKERFKIERQHLTDQAIAAVLNSDSESESDFGNTDISDTQSQQTDSVSFERTQNMQIRLDDHETRINQLESKFNDDSVPGGKRPRDGHDRARWMRIRSEDLPTKDEWCKPGCAFGYYVDGVGPLVPIEQRTRIGVVVYSTLPDTIEEHPDKAHENGYVLTVMVISFIFKQ